MRNSLRALQLLGYNNLLGFPYLHGYSASALNRLLDASGFRLVEVNWSSLLSLPYPDITSRIGREWSRVRSHGDAWIEVVGRKIR
jgi:hypothetical protein